MGVSESEKTTSVHQQPVNKVESLSTLTPGDRDGAAARLEEMGYKQELTRNLGMVSVLGLSFAIMAVPFGTSTTLNIALTDGGPVTILYGVSRSVINIRERWIDVGSGSLCLRSPYVSLPVLPRCKCLISYLALSFAVANAFVAALFFLLLGVFIVSNISDDSC